MILLIEPHHRSDLQPQLMEMHRLRARVFKERLDWGVEVRDGLEADQFDQCESTYLLALDPASSIRGCVRLLPTLGPNMLRDAFPALLNGKDCPAHPGIWESSRFAIEQHSGASTSAAVSAATIEMFAAMIEFGLSRSLIDIVTVTDVRVERLLRRAAWPLRRISGPVAFGKTTAVVGYLEVSLEALASVRCAGGIRGPVLWKPALPAASATELDRRTVSGGTHPLPRPERDGAGP